MSESGHVNIRGRDYKTVALRVGEFRAVFTLPEGWGIITECLHRDAEEVLFRAEIRNPEGRAVAVGHAEERRDAGAINRTSALENCETSAVGRALAAAGFAGSEYASADEVAEAIGQQRRGEDRDAAREAWTTAVKDVLGDDLTGEVCEWTESLGRPPPSAMDEPQRGQLLDYLRSDDGRAKFSAWLDEQAP